MTTSNYKKVFKQLKANPVKLSKYVKHNSPKDRGIGEASRRCIRCGRFGGHISRYGLHVCRQCFREIATKIGFKKYQ
jgi:small subunit ribosomal protein S14